MQLLLELLANPTNQEFNNFVMMATMLAFVLYVVKRSKQKVAISMLHDGDVIE